MKPQPEHTAEELSRAVRYPPGAISEYGILELQGVVQRKTLTMMHRSYPNLEPDSPRRGKMRRRWS